AIKGKKSIVIFGISPRNAHSVACPGNIEHHAITGGREMKSLTLDINNDGTARRPTRSIARLEVSTTAKARITSRATTPDAGILVLRISNGGTVVRNAGSSTVPHLSTVRVNTHHSSIDRHTYHACPETAKQFVAPA